MRILSFILIALVSCLTWSCSEKSTSDKPQEAKPESTIAANAATDSDEREATEKESEAAPEAEEIGEDCVAFLRATRSTPPGQEKKDCPECPSDAAVEVLKFDDFHVDRVTPGESTCEVAVTIKAQFNPSVGGEIVGGLTGWITPEQKAQYARGETPDGQQIYKVKIIYKRTGGSWRAVEFDRREGE